MPDFPVNLLRELSEGNIPEKLGPGSELEPLVRYLSDVRTLALGLARGDLKLPSIHSRGIVVQALKAAILGLRNLTRQTQRVASGDFSVRVEFMGEFSAAFNAMVEQLAVRKRLEAELHQSHRQRAIGQLAAGLAHEINTPAQFIGDSLRFLEESFAEMQGVVARYREALGKVARAPEFAELLAKLQEAEEEADLEFIEIHAPKALSSALEGVERVVAMVAALKQFAQPERNERTLADLNAALEATLAVAQNVYRDVADIETHLGELPPVMCHLGDLNQAFLQILGQRRSGGARGRRQLGAEGAHHRPELPRGRVGAGRHLRHRVRHRPRDPRPGLRAVLHHSAGGPRLRPGIGHRTSGRGRQARRVADVRD